MGSLRQKCDLQELELQKSVKRAQEAMALAAEESAKSQAAKEVIKSLTAQVIFWFLYLLFWNLIPWKSFSYPQLMLSFWQNIMCIRDVFL